MTAQEYARRDVKIAVDTVNMHAQHKRRQKQREQRCPYTTNNLIVSESNLLSPELQMVMQEKYGRGKERCKVWKE